MTYLNTIKSEAPIRVPWNKGKITGQKPPLQLKEVWSIRTHLQLTNRTRDLALFNLAIDSKLRGCDLVSLRVSDIATGNEINQRAVVRQKKTGRPVQFEITEQSRDAIAKWMSKSGRTGGEYLFPSRIDHHRHMSARQYARVLGEWLVAIGLDPRVYGTHSLRRTKVAHIYRKTGNLRAVQLLLGHTKIESTVRYLGIEVDDALTISEQTDV